MTATRALLALLAAWIVCLAVGGAAARDRHGDQVVSLSVTYQVHDEYRPWTKSKPKTRSAFAVVVEGPYLLTEAELVENATLVQVEKHGGPPNFPARVVHLDRHINLALLAVDDPGFYDDLQPVRLASAIPTDGEFRTVRWKEGQLESATSRFSRLEVFDLRGYGATVALLVLTTDIVGGGQGEPVFAGKDLVGLVEFGKDNRAHVFPPEVIRTYLDAVRDEGEYRGFASLGIYWQENRDRALAGHLGMAGETRGVVVREVQTGGSAHGVIEPRDILLSIDGYDIDADGYYLHPRYGRLKFQHALIEGHRVGDVLELQVLRGGEVLDLTMELRSYEADDALIPWRSTETAPPYLVAGGLVFRLMDLDYLRAWNNYKTNAPRRLVIAWDLERHAQTPDQRRLVLLSYVLPDPYNIGYHALNNVRVTEVNDRPVDSITDIIEALEHPVDGFHSIELQPNGTCHEIVLDAATFDEATDRILANYNIPARVRE